MPCKIYSCRELNITLNEIWKSLLQSFTQSVYWPIWHLQALDIAIKYVSKRKDRKLYGIKHITPAILRVHQQVSNQDFFICRELNIDFENHMCHHPLTPYIKELKYSANHNIRYTIEASLRVRQYTQNTRTIKIYGRSYTHLY